MVTRDQVLSCLSTLLVTSEKYRIKFSEHNTVATFLEMRKARIKDINTLVVREDKIMPVSYLLVFDSFEGILLVDKVKELWLKPNGVKLTMDSYDLEIDKVL